jgi:hypothetical protein
LISVRPVFKRNSSAALLMNNQPANTNTSMSILNTTILYHTIPYYTTLHYSIVYSQHETPCPHTITHPHSHTLTRNKERNSAYLQSSTPCSSSSAPTSDCLLSPNISYSFTAVSLCEK